MKEKLSLQDSLMAHKDQALTEARAQLSNIQEEMVAWQSQHNDMRRKLKKEQSVNEVLRRELNSMHAELDEAKKNKKELEHVKSKLNTLEGVKKMLTGTKEEVDNVIASHKSMSSLATFFIALKRDYDAVKAKRALLVKEKDKLVADVSSLKRQVLIKDDQISILEVDVHSAEEEKQSLQKKLELLQDAVDSPGSRHALQRMLESPMPDRSVNPTAGLGASPLLASPHSQSDNPKMTSRSSSIIHKHKSIKRPRDGESIVLPVKMFKSARPPSHAGSAATLKPLSSNLLKAGLKFAPKKNSLPFHPLKNTKHH
jgi:predicted nuclease with TOPRIM domain